MLCQIELVPYGANILAYTVARRKFFPAPNPRATHATKIRLQNAFRQNLCIIPAQIAMHSQKKFSHNAQGFKAATSRAQSANSNEPINGAAQIEMLHANVCGVLFNTRP